MTRCMTAEKLSLTGNSSGNRSTFKLTFKLTAVSMCGRATVNCKLQTLQVKRQAVCTEMVYFWFKKCVFILVLLCLQLY